jgi:mono/diheme cytochrome c family protein
MTGRVAAGFVLIAGGLLLGSSSCSARASGDATAGKDVYLKKCKICHGEDGHGNAGMAKLLKTTIPTLDSEEVQSLSDADLRKIITEGKGKMKPVAGLSDADISNVIAYVRTFKKK